MSLYDSVRASVDHSTTGVEEERVEVNQRALIDKILARYASAGAVYRELLQNSNDADATVAEVHFTVSSSSSSSTTTGATSTSSVVPSSLSSPIVTSVMYRNNGMPFRKQDWSRLKKIAEGNPDESKIGAFGVGAYTMFSICEAPMVLSGNSALAFVWKGDTLWTKTIDKERSKEEALWTSFLLPSRDPYPLPDLVEFGEFLCASLTFTKCLKEIRVFVGTQDQPGTKPRMVITKTLLQPPSVVQVYKSNNWFKKDGAVLVTPNGLFTLKDQQSLLESMYHFQVELDDQKAGTTARYLSGTAATKIPANMVKRMERVTKKKPPSHVQVQLFLNGQQHDDIVEGGGGDPSSAKSKHRQKKNKAQRILQSFAPPPGGGRIFIGFRTSQTTGLAAHVAAPFVPTVEREAMDLQDPTLRQFNMELLEFSGILLRLTLEHGMRSVGMDYDRGADERNALEKQLLEEQKQKHRQKKLDQEQKKKNKDPSSSSNTNDKNNDQDTDGRQDSCDNDDEDTKSTTSSVWGFAKFMAKGVKKKVVKVLNTMEEVMETITNDDTNELLNPPDLRPLCAEEHQAILLMQSFCPQPSTPDPLVGTALAQGFSRCLPDRAPPVLTRAGVVPGNEARLPHQGMQAFSSQVVTIRSIVYQNAEEYHDVIARCPRLSLDDVAASLSSEVLEEAQAIKLLRWWVKFSKLPGNSRLSRKGGDLKERIRFFMENPTQKSDEPLQVYSMRDYLFYLDSNVIRPSTIGNNNKDVELPMPESILPKSIQDQVGFRNLTDSSMESWFAPLPIDIWVEFIGHHPSMNQGQPEDEKLRLHVLSTLGQEYSRRQFFEKDMFGSLCSEVFKDRRCIPFDSTEPSTAYCADCPSNLYLYSAELEAFDGIGCFHKASQSLKHVGVTEEFLLTLGVRKSVAIDFLFANLDTLKWSSDPKPLIEYLRSATLTGQDSRKLHSTQYLPAENDTSRMFAPSELYLPDKDLRLFPFVRLLQWPSTENNDELSERTLNGKFLVQLGMKVLPPLVQMLRYIANEIPKDDMATRLQCLQFVCKRLGSGGAYQDEYNRLSTGQRGELKFLPCVIQVPIDNIEQKGLYSPAHCCSDPRCGVMGFPIIDPSLENNQGKLFGSLFQCAAEPQPRALLQQLLALVKLSQKKMKESPSVSDRAMMSQRIAKTFSDVFAYLSSRTSDIDGTFMAVLQKQPFVPYLTANGQLEWYRPDEVFFKAPKKEGEESDYSSVTETLFRVVEFSPFLAAAGVKQEASTKDIFRLMIESPETVMKAVNGSEAKYRSLLRRVAAHRPFSRVTKDIRDSPFLLAYQPADGTETAKTSNDGLQEQVQHPKFKLAKAEDIHIIDNSFFGRMFPVDRAPHESDLEDFYSLIGSPYISKHVKKNFDVVGSRRADTPLALALAERIHERSPLLVSPSVTSRPLVSNAAAVLDESHLEIYEVPELLSFYTLGKSSRSQKTTCCSQPSRGKRNVLFVTKNFDWFDVGFALGELILVRCQLEDAFFISSLLEAPLEQLRNRGFPVDRIIKPEPLPEPEAPPPPPPKPTPPAAAVGVDGRDNTKTPAVVPDTDAPVSAPQNGHKSSQDGTVAELPPPASSKATSAGASDASSIATESTAKSKDSDPSVDQGPPPSREGFAAILKQMYPDADEDFIYDRLGPEPTLDDVRTLAEEMAMTGYPKDANKMASQQIESPPKPNKKVLGSKKLGRAFNGLRGSNFGGATAPKPPSNTEMGTQSAMAGSGAGPVPPNDGRPVPPELDATSHANMEKMLEQTVSESSRVDTSGVSSPNTQLGIPEGLDRGASCEVIPGQNLSPFPGPHKNGKTHNGILVFSARLHPSSQAFLQENFDVAESFSVVLQRLCVIYDLPLSSVCIFHDPTGGTIAFNSNRSLHFNLRFFYALHYLQNKHHSRECYSYWFVTAAHELAHHMASGHNKEHGFYTESYVSLYLPKLVGLFAQLGAT